MAALLRYPVMDAAGVYLGPVGECINHLQMFALVFLLVPRAESAGAFLTTKAGSDADRVLHALCTFWWAS